MRLSPSDWAASVFNVWVATILLSEQLQLPTKIVQYPGDDLGYYHHDQPGITFGRPAGYNYAAIAAGSDDFSCASFPDVPTTKDEDCAHAMLEVWSGQDDNKAKYIQQEGTVENGGDLGATGRLGWYTHARCLDAHPELASYRGLTDAALTAAIFKRPLTFSEACALNHTNASAALCAAIADETVAAEAALSTSLAPAYYLESLPSASAVEALAAHLGVTRLPSPLYGGAFVTHTDPATGLPIGHHTGVPCGWTEYDQQIIESLGLALQTVRYTYDELMQVHDAAAHTGEWLLFWWWRPSALISTRVDAQQDPIYARVALPPHTEQCKDHRDVDEDLRCAGIVTSSLGGCDYPVEVLYKTLSTSLAEHSPAAHRLLSQLQVCDCDTHQGPPTYTHTHNITHTHCTTLPRPQITRYQHEDFLLETSPDRMDAEPMAMRDAACKWVRDNNATWASWLPDENLFCPSVLNYVESLDKPSLNVTCGFNGGGTCTPLEKPYPEGRCECLEPYEGDACEQCNGAAGFFPYPRKPDEPLYPRLRCMQCSQLVDAGSIYASECAFVTFSSADSIIMICLGGTVALGVLFVTIARLQSCSCGKNYRQPVKEAVAVLAEARMSKEPLLLQVLMLVGAILLCAAPTYSTTRGMPTRTMCMLSTLLPFLGYAMLMCAALLRARSRWRFAVSETTSLALSHLANLTEVSSTASTPLLDTKNADPTKRPASSAFSITRVELIGSLCVLIWYVAAVVAVFGSDVLQIRLLMPSADGGEFGPS